MSSTASKFSRRFGKSLATREIGDTDGAEAVLETEGGGDPDEGDTDIEEANTEEVDLDPFGDNGYCDGRE